MYLLPFQRTAGLNDGALAPLIWPNFNKINAYSIRPKNLGKKNFIVENLNLRMPEREREREIITHWTGSCCSKIQSLNV